MFKATFDLKKHKFFEVLENVFVGERIEGEGGYVNLLKVKSEYFRKKVKPELENLIEEKTKDFPEFREELMDKLYDFFHRYLNETGTPFMFLTPYYASIYDRIYGEEDVKLYWKTSRHYYVKSDRIFRSMKVEVNGFSVFFDVSNLEYKKANEKRELIYEFENYDKNEKLLTLKVYYREGNRKTNISEIRKKIKDNLFLKKYTNEIPSEEAIKKAISIFERQSKVDYFICKDARSFLKEQFDLWLFQYLFGKPGEVDITLWTEKRIKQIQVLKEIAYRVIDFIARFEDELLKIWLKPRFVLNSNYVITLDRLENKKEKGGIEVIKKILNHLGFDEQVKEWKELGIVDEKFDRNEVLIRDLYGERLNPDYKFLPIDTRYFKDLELEILSLFDDLDEELDGWLIKSENFQALNTILPRFKESVKVIYIDPPYNTGSDEFVYEDHFRSSSYLTMLENRLSLVKLMLRKDGVIFASIANNENVYKESYRVGELMSMLFPKRFADLIWKRRGGSGSYSISEITENHEYILMFGREEAKVFTNILTEKDLARAEKDENGIYVWKSLEINQYTKEQRPNLYYPVIYNFVDDRIEFDKSENEIDPNKEVAIYPSPKSVFVMTKESLREVYKRGVVRVFYNKGKWEIKLKKYLYKKDGTIQGYPLKSLLDDNDIPWKIGYTADATKELKNLFGEVVYFSNPKPVGLIKLLLYVSTDKTDIALDFFAGSGTLAHALMDLNRMDGGRRKFILVEMADYFYTVIIPRLKKLAYSMNWHEGRPVDKDSVGIFIKYFELEQYDEILKRIRYNDSKSNINNLPEKNLFTVDEKYLSNIEEINGVLYFDYRKFVDRRIDLSQTLSFLKGKALKKLSKDYIEFKDGDKIDLKDGYIKLSYIKDILWWK